MGVDPLERLRVAFIAGTLGQGGAEKQLIYMVKALVRKGVSVKVYTLTHGEYFEPSLCALGVQPEWIGQNTSPLLRLMTLANSLRKFQPHIVQAVHFYVNLYAALLSPLVKAESIGSIRNDTYNEIEGNPFWGKLLLTFPNAMIANSYRAQHNAEILGIGQKKLFVLPNVIDLTSFDIHCLQLEKKDYKLSHSLAVVTVGRLVSEKRFDRFICALALARREIHSLTGIIIGDGPERIHLERLARQNNLSENELIFLGQKDDVPSILRQADIFLQTSDHEGFPNVLLESMAAGLPIICTPAGDSDIVVQDGLTGYVVPFEDVDSLAARIVKLAHSPQLRRQLGREGRVRVEQFYDIALLPGRLLSIYEQIAHQRRSSRLLNALLSLNS